MSARDVLGSERVVGAQEMTKLTMYLKPA